MCSSLIRIFVVNQYSHYVTDASIDFRVRLGTCTGAAYQKLRCLKELIWEVVTHVKEFAPGTIDNKILFSLKFYIYRVLQLKREISGEMIVRNNMCPKILDL